MVPKLKMKKYFNNKTQQSKDSRPRIKYYAIIQDTVFTIITFLYITNLLKLTLIYDDFCSYLKQNKNKIM